MKGGICRSGFRRARAAGCENLSFLCVHADKTKIEFWQVPDSITGASELVEKRKKAIFWSAGGCSKWGRGLAVVCKDSYQCLGGCQTFEAEWVEGHKSWREVTMRNPWHSNSSKEARVWRWERLSKEMRKMLIDVKLFGELVKLTNWWRELVKWGWLKSTM